MKLARSTSPTAAEARDCDAYLPRDFHPRNLGTFRRDDAGQASDHARRQPQAFLDDGVEVAQSFELASLGSSCAVGTEVRPDRLNLCSKLG